MATFPDPKGGRYTQVWLYVKFSCANGPAYPAKDVVGMEVLTAETNPDRDRINRVRLMSKQVLAVSK